MFGRKVRVQVSKMAGGTIAVAEQYIIAPGIGMKTSMV